MQGIEILVLSTYTLTTEHITNKFNFDFKSYSLVASYIFAIYFILKSIIVYTKGRKELAEELSDIREIVKKDEPVIKEATRKNKDNEEYKKEEKEIKNKKEETKTTKTANKTKTTKKNGTNTQKTTKKQKTNTSKTSKNTNKKPKKKKEEVKKND